MRNFNLMLSIAAMTLLTACSSQTLGPVGPAPDARPYFVVFDGPGRTCDAVKFDGAPWNHPSGEPVAVSERRHHIECGGYIADLAIPSGLIYKFDFR